MSSILTQFAQFLNSKGYTFENRITFYEKWVLKFFQRCGKSPGDDFDSLEVEHFLEHMKQYYKQWQIDQAADAIQLFSRFLEHKTEEDRINAQQHIIKWNESIDKFIKELRILKEWLRLMN